MTNAAAEFDGTRSLVLLTPHQLVGLVKAAVEEALAERAQDIVPALLDRAGISRVLGVGTSTLDRLRREGMPCVLIGDSPRFEPSACLEWLRNHRDPGG